MLYAGLTPTLWRAFPANAAQWLTWDILQRQGFVPCSILCSYQLQALHAKVETALSEMRKWLIIDFSSAGSGVNQCDASGRLPCPASCQCYCGPDWPVFCTKLWQGPYCRVKPLQGYLQPHFVSLHTNVCNLASSTAVAPNPHQPRSF